MKAMLNTNTKNSYRYGFWVFALLTVLLMHGCGAFMGHGKWGYIDRRGEWVIPPRFDLPPGQFHSAMAPIPTPHGWRFIDRNGTFIEKMPTSTCELSEISEGLTLCAQRKKTQRGRFLTGADFDYKYVDTNGRTILTPEIVSGCGFHEGLAGVLFEGTKNTKLSMWGYIDKKGGRVIDGKFFSAGPFVNGLAAVEVGAHFEGSGGVGSFVGGKYGYIDRAGRFVIQPAFKHAGPFSECGLAAVDAGYIDRSGVLKLQGPYTKTGDFSEGVAPAAQNFKFGFIDTNGNWVASPAWDDADSFSEGLAGVGTDTGTFEDEESRQGHIFKCGFVDKSFKVVIPQKFRAVRPFSEGLAAALAE
jgi:hypothetical protein